MSINTIALPASISFAVGTVDTFHDGNKWGTVITLLQQDLDTLSLANQTIEFVQTEECTTGGVAVDKYGAFTVDSSCSNDLSITITGVINGTYYDTESAVALYSVAPGDVITLTKRS